MSEDKREDNEEMKQKAKLYCKCTEQWKIISKYNPDKLKTWVEEKEFDQIKALHETIFSYATRVIGYGLDKMCKGDDYVDQEIQNDISLRESIEIECANWVQFLSNRFRIVTLLGVDIANGKLKQIKENKSTIVITEENGSDYVEPIIEPIVVHPGAEEEIQGSGEVPVTNPSITIMAARKGSGKSTALMNQRGWKGLYDKIHIFSPTFRTQYEILWKQIASDGVTVHENLSDEALSRIYDSQYKDPSTKVL